ncbi:hypothetical protein BKA62DRAFT_695689 [Auriculariales sp. MPI-PUGE-AT-0066]|nr:hypothetical protein BKA62DRAFT_695689 [Auriculariales sp. MPI-PUGE-AT-0066]
MAHQTETVVQLRAATLTPSISGQCSFERLNNDTLELIIYAALKMVEDKFRMKATCRISQVSRRIRDIVHSRARFWNRIYVEHDTPGAAVLAGLRLSRTVPLSLTLGYLSEQIEDPLIQMERREILREIGNHLARVRVLVVDGCDERIIGAPLAPFIEIIRLQGLAPLATLNIRRGSPPVDQLFHLAGSRLVHINLDSVSVPIHQLARIFKEASCMRCFRWWNSVEIDKLDAGEWAALDGCDAHAHQLDSIDVLSSRSVEQIVRLLTIFHRHAIVNGSFVAIRHTKNLWHGGSGWLDTAAVLEHQQLTVQLLDLEGHLNPAAIQICCYSDLCMSVNAEIPTKTGTKQLKRGFFVNTNLCYEPGPVRSIMQHALTHTAELNWTSSVAQNGVLFLREFTGHSWSRLTTLSVNFGTNSDNGGLILQDMTSVATWGVVKVPVLRQLSVTVSYNEPQLDWRAETTTGDQLLQFSAQVCSVIFGLLDMPRTAVICVQNELPESRVILTQLETEVARIYQALYDRPLSRAIVYSHEKAEAEDI